MPRKIYLSAQPKDKERYDELNTDRAVAAVSRQSGERQRTNQSAKTQKINLPDHLVKKGWKGIGIDIHPIDEGRAISGTVDILSRRSGIELWDLIESGKIGTVAVVHEDRLFRDKIGNQAATFAVHCRDHRVKIYVQDKRVYCFHDPVEGDKHLDEFVQECRAAWRYIRYHVKGRMLTNRKDKGLEGKWIGGSIAPGFVVNLETQKIEPFSVIPALQDWSTVVQDWFDLLLKYRGNVSQTWKHIKDHGPYLPDYDDPALRGTMPKDADGRAMFRFEKPNSAHKRNGHYYPSRAGLRYVLTNPVYIGWLILNDCEAYDSTGGEHKRAYRAIDRTIIENNHLGIVDPVVFWQVYNLLSKETVDGKPNPNYIEHHTTRPKNVDSPRRKDVLRPFLEGILFNPDTRGELQRTLVIWNEQTGKYEYAACSWDESRGQESRKLWTKNASLIDYVVQSELATLIRREKYAEVSQMLESQLAANSVVWDKDRKRLISAVKSAEQALPMARKHYFKATTDSLIEEAGAQVSKLESDIARYRQELAAIDALEEADKADLEELAWVFESSPDYWLLSDEQARVVLELFIEKVMARRNGRDLEITIVWRGGQTTPHVIGMHGVNAWTQAEYDRLVELIEAKAQPLEIAAALPGRTWGAIILKSHALTGKCLSKTAPIKLSQTFEAYQRTNGVTNVEFGTLKTRSCSNFQYAEPVLNLPAILLFLEQNPVVKRRLQDHFTTLAA